MKLTQTPVKPELPKKIEALLTPNAYPDRTATTGKIELIQTHISYVLLTDNFAYKIKKPVNLGFLDFTTLENRRHFCLEEIRLNRRLAPTLYIDVVTVTEKNGVYRIDDAQGAAGSTVVDYAVKMKRIPRGATLEERIEEGSVTEENIRSIGERIARFHYNIGAGASTDERISDFGAPEKIKENTDENFAQTKSFTGDLIPEETFALLKKYTDNFLTRHEELFKARVTEGFIRDCHGDIHAEHVVLMDNNRIEIFDCIEFSERFRFSDTVAEIAFLSMDLDFRGRPLFAEALEEGYFSAAGDLEGRQLLNFYKTYRAYIRGKVEGFKFYAKGVAEDERAAALFNACHHFYLAGMYALEKNAGYRAPRLIIVRGLSGTGKSVIAKKTGRLLGAAVISSDKVRKELAGIDPSEHRYEEFGKGIYSPDFTDKTYEELFRRAESVLASGLTCLLDATFADTERLKAATSLTGKKGYRLHIIETTAPEEVVLKRIENRAKKEVETGRAVSDATLDIYALQKRIFGTLDTGVTKVDTSLDECEVLRVIATEIFG